MWVAVVGAALLFIAGIAVVLPSKGTDTRAKRPPAPPSFGGGAPTASVPFETTPDPEAERRRGAAEAAVHPLADAFVRAVIARRGLADAYALLSSDLRSRYSLHDWQGGRDLPFTAKHHERYSGSSVVFSDASMVGLVASLTPPDAAAGETQSLLLALRFEKARGRWSLHYVHAGHGSRYVTASATAGGRFSRPRPGYKVLVEFADAAARNEEVFRDVNERIDAGADRLEVATPLPFHCECADASCVERIFVTPQDYKGVVDEPFNFMVIPGHENGEIERVVVEHRDFLVVEKVGEAREQLERDHPQQRHRAE